MKISLLTAGKDPHYALGLLSALISKGIIIDFIGNDSMTDAGVVHNNSVTYHNLRGDQSPHVALKEKVIRVLKYYFTLIKYAATTDSKIFHILWLNKFLYFDMTLLNVYYKCLGKRIVYTAHNINIKERDGRNTIVNKLCLSFLYKVVDHIFVHTEKMKQQLLNDYKLRHEKVSVIPFGINNAMPNSALTCRDAKKIFHFKEHDKVILFFGNIAPYKGLEYLLLALVHLKEQWNDFKLIIAGRIKNCDSYWRKIQGIMKDNALEDHIICKTEYIPDEHVQDYFKASDVLILPYKYIFQSGVIFLSYNFGLPVIAADIGSLKEDVDEGKTGFMCKPEDPIDLAKKIHLYFQSDLYYNLEENRDTIITYANEKHSWDNVGDITHAVYENLLVAKS